MVNIPGLEPLAAEERLGVDLAKSEIDLIRQLVDARRAKGIKPAELARTMGVDRSAISRFEAGGTNPTLATINRYAEAVGVMITYAVQSHTRWQLDQERKRRWNVDLQLQAEDLRQIEETQDVIRRQTGLPATQYKKVNYHLKVVA